jgi:metacaspase-1
MKAHRSLRQFILNTFVLSFVLLVLGAGYTQAQIKYGLIVAVGSQPTDTRWTSNSAANDAKVMEQLLENKGFDSIIVLVDEQATKEAIILALDQAYLSLGANDVFVFHFSGHGQKLADNNSDDIDGYDEALVAYGAPSEYDRWYNDEHHIRDDQFSEIIDRLRSKLGVGGELLVLVDAGFGSAEGIKGDSIRGGKKAIVPEGFVNRSIYTDVNTGIYENRPFGSPSNSYSPIISITGAFANQAGMEHNGNGLLTQVIDRAFEKIVINETYQQLFVRMNAIANELGFSNSIAIDGSYKTKVFNGNALNRIESSFSNWYDADINLNVIRALMANEEQSVLRFLKEEDPRQKSLF